MLVFDSYAWIEYFIGSQQGVIAKEHLESKEPILTPDIVLAEIARKYLRESVAETEIKKRLYFITAQSEIKGVDAELAIAAAKAWDELTKRAKKKRLGKPSLTDGIVLALARRHEGKVLTGDEHLAGLTEVMML